VNHWRAASNKRGKDGLGREVIDAGLDAANIGRRIGNKFSTELVAQSSPMVAVVAIS